LAILISPPSLYVRERPKYSYSAISANRKNNRLFLKAISYQSIPDCRDKIFYCAGNPENDDITGWGKKPGNMGCNRKWDVAEFVIRQLSIVVVWESRFHSFNAHLSQNVCCADRQHFGDRRHNLQ
jgi:hypothetical protein